jgi:hypothetical protein
MISE